MKFTVISLPPIRIEIDLDSVASCAAVFDKMRVLGLNLEHFLTPAEKLRLAQRVSDAATADVMAAEGLGMMNAAAAAAAPQGVPTLARVLGGSGPTLVRQLHRGGTGYAH